MQGYILPDTFPNVKKLTISWITERAENENKEIKMSAKEVAELPTTLVVVGWKNLEELVFLRANAHPTVVKYSRCPNVQKVWCNPVHKIQMGYVKNNFLF